jgi:hypothetical protein
MQTIIKNFEEVEKYLNLYNQEAQQEIENNNLIVKHKNENSSLSIHFKINNNGNTDFKSAVFFTW